MDAGLAVRAAHLLAMGAMLGGSALCLWVLARQPAHARPVLRGYEWVFWAAAGLSVATGVGSLGVFGQTPPDPASGWGAAFRWKLGLALLGLPVSAIRAVLARAGGAGSRRALLVLHAATVAGVAVAVVLGEVMAHGG